MAELNSPEVSSEQDQPRKIIEVPKFDPPTAEETAASQIPRFVEPSEETSAGQADQVEAARSAVEAAEKNKPDFSQVHQVAVLRASGDLELDWQVAEINGDKVVVTSLNPEGKAIEKTYTSEALAKMQPKFLDGQTVPVDSTRGPEGWRVFRQEPNGMVLVVKEAGEGRIHRKRIEAAHLEDWRVNGLPKKEESASKPTSHKKPGRRWGIFGR